jgi:pseudouridine-5'-phosphate glycosidase/pseudouridine kinase
LIKNNTEIACQIAKAYHGPGKGNSWQVSRLCVFDLRLSVAQHTFQPALPHKSEDILVIGAAAIDITAQANNIEGPERQPSEASNHQGTTVAGTVRSNPGGVARNMAEAAHRLGASTKLATSFNPSDAFGATLTHHLADLRMPVHNFKAGSRTAVCNSILQHDGQLLTGVADMDSTFSRLSLEEVCLAEMSALALVDGLH